MSKIPGVGFDPLHFGGRTARYRHNGVWTEGPFDPSANAFFDGVNGGGAADGPFTEMDPAGASRRWGGYTPGDDLQGRGAERLLGVGWILNEAFKQRRPGLGTPETHTGVATWQEAYDRSLLFAKHEAPFLDLDNNPDEGGGRTPGQPAITALSSPEPGVIDVSWKTRAGHTRFAVVLDGGPGFSGVSDVPVTDSTATSFSRRIEHVEGGEISVTVTAFIGDTAGVPSLPKTVAVIAATPIDPPPPPPPPLPVDVPPSTTLSPAAREAVAILRRKLAAGKQGKGGLTVLIGPDYKPKLDALLDELSRLP